MEHTFTKTINDILLARHFDGNAAEVFAKSELLQYINLKTKSANKGSKSRGSFANLYAIYVLVEDYVKGRFDNGEDYTKYGGAEYSKLFDRQRQLPFGGKLQNHALNNRVNHEFKKYFPTSEYQPILHVAESKRYWINQGLLNVKIDGNDYNIAKAILEIIDAYGKTKQDSFQRFIQQCEELKSINNESPDEAISFVFSLLEPNVDARLFEIVSYSILKIYYRSHQIIWGFLNPSEIEGVIKIHTESLHLYKTGRTNANDGGIDFVMKPLGRFFQVTETVDFKKYFLDIDKIEKYPITFVIKSSEDVPDLLDKIRSAAIKSYGIEAIVERYMDCIEELINIPTLHNRFGEIIGKGDLKNVLEEIIIQSKVEFNYLDPSDLMEDDENELDDDE